MDCGLQGRGLLRAAAALLIALFLLVARTVAQEELYFDEAEPLACGVCDDGCDPLLWESGAGLPLLRLLQGRLYGEADYLLGWTSPDTPPALVTTAGTVALTPLPTGTVLFGGDVNGEARSGGKFTLGLWLDPCYTSSVEVSYLFLGDQSTAGQWSNPGYAILARPYEDITTGQQASHVVVDTASGQTGTLNVADTNRFYTIDAILRRNLYQWSAGRFDFLAGYRFARMSDDLLIDEAFNATAPVAAVTIHDEFLAENRFHGVDLGFSTELRRNRWALRVLMKLGIGSTQSRMTIRGASAYNTATYPIGLLALESNAGVYDRNVLSVVPELGVRLAYNFSPRLRGTVGYSFLYWNQVLRAGEHVPTSLNPDLFPPPLIDDPPSNFAFHNSDFWVQGLTLGLDYCF